MDITMRLVIDVTGDLNRIIEMLEGLPERPTQGQVAQELAGQLADRATDYGVDFTNVHDTEILMGL